MPVSSDNSSLSPNSRNYSIENRNFLSPVGFKFIIGKMPGVDFFCQSANIPAISLGVAEQPTRFNTIPQPGDEVQYEKLYIRFLVDENMKNWSQVHDWIREMGTPVSDCEFGYSREGLASRNPVNRRIDTEDDALLNDWRCDCTLFILSSNYQPVAEIVFRDAWPTELSTIRFDSSVPDINYFTADVTLVYSYYDYEILDASTETDETMKPRPRKSKGGIELL